MKKRAILKRIIIVLSVFLCTEACAFIYLVTSEDSSYTRNHNLGNKYLLSADYDAAIKAYEMRKILLRKYCKENNVRIPEELLTTHGYNRARAQTHMLAREIEDFEEYLKIALAMYYEKVWNGKEVDSEDSDAPFTIQSLEYAKLLLDLPSLLQSRLEQDVMMSAHSLGDILADHDEFLNEQTKQELQAVCDGLLKLKGESVWQALINVEIPIE